MIVRVHTIYSEMENNKRKLNVHAISNRVGLISQVEKSARYKYKIAEELDVSSLSIIMKREDV